MAVPECVNGPCDDEKSSSSSASLKNDKKLLVVSQEIKFARVLAGNNPRGRERAVKNLKKWFENRAETVAFTEDDFMRIWKGLFYSMWMSDKPLIQEECAENISSLLHSLPTTEASLLFFKSGLMILINEWFGIDQLRLDKFLMLVRRLLRQAIVVLKNANFQRSSIKLFTKYLSETILKTNHVNHDDDDVNINKKIPLGLLMHFTDIYLEELAKIGGADELNINLLPEFLTPFIQYLALCDDDRLLRHINDNIFIYLIKQSDLGLEYQAKYNVWRQQQFCGTIDDIKRIEINNDDADHDDDDDDDDEKIYDPRAGRVNVELPQLKFHPKAVAAKLLQHKFDKGSKLKSRKTITKLAELFKQMATTGKYPIGIKQLNLIKKKNNDDDDVYDTNINNAVKRLIEFDDEIMDRKPPLSSQQQNGNDDALLEVKKNKKRKNDNVDDEKDTTVAAVEKRTKRKNLSSSSSAAAASIKRQKIATNHQMNEFNNFDNVESIFARNSGIWVVTTTTTTESPQTIDNNNKDSNEMKKEIVKKSNEIKPRELIVTDSNTTTTSTAFIVENNNNNSNNNNKENKTFLKKKRATAAAAIDKKVNNKNLNKLVNKKKLKKILSRNILENLDQKLVNNNLTTTPTKKVKINMKLNTSQDVSEHHAQIKSSPAIPYDASKKPLKPLLKTATATTLFSSSPINPFYNCL